MFVNFGELFINKGLSTMIKSTDFHHILLRSEWYEISTYDSEFLITTKFSVFLTKIYNLSHRNHHSDLKWCYDKIIWVVVVPSNFSSNGISTLNFELLYIFRWIHHFNVSWYVYVSLCMFTHLLLFCPL